MTLPAVLSDLCWPALNELEPKSASKSTAAGLAVTGGDRGEGNVIGWAVVAGGQPDDEAVECVAAGLWTDCV